MRKLTHAACVVAALTAGACASTGEVQTPAGAGLEGTAWRLEAFQSSDDKVGTIRPDDPGKYEIRFMTEGRLAMKLDCNRGVGHWSATASDASHGALTLSHMGMTRAACLGPSLDTRIARDTEQVRGYVVKGDELSLSLAADGGVYTWRRIAE